MIDGRRPRILAALGEPSMAMGAGDIGRAICRFVVDNLDVSGCSILLMSPASSVDVLAASGEHALAVADLQFTLGEGPCFDAYNGGAPVFAPDLANFGGRWPVYAAAATDLGVLAEFSLPLQVGAAGLGTLDLSRGTSGMVDAEELADALVAADIATDALLVQDRFAGSWFPSLLDGGEINHAVVHQATGMIAIQLEVDTSDALAALRAAAFRSGRSIRDLALDVVERRVRFKD